jgi:hypothetical protein
MRRSQSVVLSSLTSIYSTPSNRFRLPLPVYPLSQVLQITERFYQTPLPPIIARGITKQLGPFAPWELPQFIATLNPSATLSSSAAFLVWPVIRLPCSAIFLGGTRRASPVARYVLVTVLPLPPRRSDLSPRSARDMPCCLRPEGEGSASGSIFFRGHLWVYLRCGPVTCSPSFPMALSAGFTRFVILRGCDPS